MAFPATNRVHHIDVRFRLIYRRLIRARCTIIEPDDPEYLEWYWKIWGSGQSITSHQAVRSAKVPDPDQQESPEPQPEPDPS